MRRVQDSIQRPRRANISSTLSSVRLLRFGLDQCWSTHRVWDLCEIASSAENEQSSSKTGLTLRRLMSYIYIYMEHPFLMFLDHTQRRSTVGRTPLDE